MNNNWYLPLAIVVMALILAFFRRGLLTVAIGATAVVFLTEQAVTLLG